MRRSSGVRGYGYGQMCVALRGHGGELNAAQGKCAAPICFGVGPRRFGGRGRETDLHSFDTRRDGIDRHCIAKEQQGNTLRGNSSARGAWPWISEALARHGMVLK